jgi:tripartite-type tricarboxylate transporter receptor subunit TctC
LQSCWPALRATGAHIEQAGAHGGAFPPGGSTDLAARSLGEKLAAVLGQPFVIDNKPGASGNIGAEFVARSAPDGYTLLMAATSSATAPAFFPQLGWDPVKDFAPVSMVATVPIIVVVHPSVVATNARELIAYSKANPGKLNSPRRARRADATRRRCSSRPQASTG